jgi:hypothetical protein
MSLSKAEPGFLAAKGQMPQLWHTPANMRVSVLNWSVLSG